MAKVSYSINLKNTFECRQLLKKKSNSLNEVPHSEKEFMTSVCSPICPSVYLSINPNNDFCKYSSITTKLPYDNRCHPRMFLIENHICSCYTLSTGLFKRNPMRSMGDIDFK